jgi:tetratricopeptide (TPR) repeat protein
MWIASHLNCLPFEGLTDKYLGDAPSVRGELLSLDEHIERVFAESESDEVPPSKSWDRQRFMIAQKNYTSEHTERDTNYVMREQRPEYLLLFVRHQENGESALDRPILRAIHESEERINDYVLDVELLKFKPNYNAIYRRKDVPAGIPDRLKLERLRQAIELNPRTYHQVILLYEQILEFQDVEVRAEARALVLERLELLGRDPDEVRRLFGEAQKRNDAALIEALIIAGLEQRPHSPIMLQMAAERAWREGRTDEAIEAIEEAVRHAPRSTNQYHHSLAQYYRVLGRWNEAIDVAGAAAERRPDDRGAWAGLAHLADIASRDPERGLDERIDLARRAAEAYRKTDEIDRITGSPGKRYFERARAMEREIAIMESQVDSE